MFALLVILHLSRFLQADLRFTPGVVPDVISIEGFTDQQVIDLASAYPVESIPSNRLPAINTAQVNQIYSYVAAINRISIKSAIIGTHQHLRKRAANSGSPLELGVEVFDPESKRSFAFTKGELIMCICKSGACSKDDKNVCRTFAESVAVVTCSAAIKLHVVKYL